MSRAIAYTPSIFNTQQLLFDRAIFVSGSRAVDVSDDYYKHGWTVIDDVADAQEALIVQQDFIRSIDPNEAPEHSRFGERVQLAKADQIPVCDDIIATSFQVLHFDMGHPFVESDDQLLVTHVGIYLPSNTTHEITAKTRLIELDGLLKGSGLDVAKIEKRLLAYVQKYGDGWQGHNTFRLACFARFIDALGDNPELEAEIDKTVGQWFQNDTKLDAQSAYDQEVAFYARHGIELKKVEHQIALKSGQLLILDNTRVIHGRIGNRKAKELYNFMWGIEAATHNDIVALRRYISQALV